LKKITKLLTGTLAFTILFYDHTPGLNALLITLIVWGLLSINNKRPAINPLSRVLSLALWLSALSFTWYGDFFSFAAMFVSLLAFGMHRQFPRINIMLYPALWCLNYVSFIFRFFLFKNWLPKREPANNFWKKLLALVVIPSFFLLLFIMMYASGSDIFSSFFQKFTHGIDVLQLIFLVSTGFFLLFNLFFMWLPRPSFRINSGLVYDFNPAKQQLFKPTFSFLDISFERKSGEITLVSLNILLLFFLATYNYEQFFSPINTGTLSNEIHQRVNTIIFSIIMAIGVIMLYFKSTFNFDSKAANLKGLAVVWIILNALLILSAIIKNSEYIINFGLTYKRIGVYIFLTLSLIGLLITYIKIRNKKTNSYLLSKMAWVFGATFIIASWVNFSWVVTKYNIVYNKKDDIEYLKSLDYNKQILYDTFKNDPLWTPYFENQKALVKDEKNKDILSSAGYYHFLNFNK
jgi:hypothetical protein